MQFEIRDLITIGTIVFAAGILYGNIKSFRKEFETDRKESWEWRRRLERTMYGDDGRNGLVGDSIKHGEHIEGCKKRQSFGTRSTDIHG